MKRSLSKRIQHQIEYFFMRGMMILVWIAPLPASFKAAEALGRFTFSLLRIRRAVVLGNLKRAFPDRTDKELLKIALAAYQNFGKFVIEYMRIPIEKKKDVLSRREIAGLEDIDEGLRLGKGVVLVGGHYGNFESMGSIIPLLGYPTTFLVGRQHNAMVDDIINRYRAMSGAEIVHRGVAVRGALKALRDNKVLIFLSDQDARKMGIFIQFFGTPASTPQGAAAFALKTGARLIFGIDVPQGKGRHRLVYTHVDSSRYQGFTPENMRDLTQDYTDLLEEQIRKYPEPYFWMHKRWKSKPRIPTET